MHIAMKPRHKRRVKAVTRPEKLSLGPPWNREQRRAMRKLLANKATAERLNPPRSDT